MKSKYKFQIGTWVCANNKAYVVIARDIPDKGPWLRRVIKKSGDVYGQVCGMVRKQVGTYHSACYGDDGDGAYISVDRIQMLYEVREGMSNKPVLCFEEDLQLAVGDMTGVPLMKQNQPPWTEESKRWAREDAKLRKRDATGRFLSKREQLK